MAEGWSGARSAKKPRGHAPPVDRAFVVVKKRVKARGAKGRRKGRCVKDTDSESNSAEVPSGAKQAEEAYGRWPWVERSVWNERMLQALEDGVKGGKWFSLIDKVWKKDNLSAAWMKAFINRGSAGVDGQSLQQFTMRLSLELNRLHEELRQGRYQPMPVRRHWIPKPGSQEKRPLGIPAVRDRIVQGACRHVLEPIFEKEFGEHSYGFRPGRGCKDALRRVDQLLEKGQTWVVDVDLKSYLDPYSYYTLAAEGWSKSWGWLSNTRMLKPFCLPRLTWTTESSPRFTRCMMVWRDTPRMRMAWGIAT